MRIITRHAIRHAVLTSLAVLGLTARAAGQPAPAAPQESGTPTTLPFQVQFDVAAGMVYDDNLFWRPVNTADTIARISPSIEARRESARFSFSSHYRLDSERYTQHPELNDAFAAQSSDLDFIVRNPMTSLSLRGTYARTHRPGELNTTTGLVLGRQLASVGGSSAVVAHRMGPHSTVQAGYGFDGTDITIGPDSLEHDAHLRLARDVGSQDQIYVTYRGEHWTFYPDTSILNHTILSHTGVLGWTRRLTPFATLTLEAGPRLSSGEVRPEVAATVSGRVAERAAISLSYAHTRTAAVGVLNLVDTDRILWDMTYRNPAAWEVMLGGGVFRDVVPGLDRVVAYQATADIRRAITRRVWLVATGRMSFNTRQAGDVAPGNEEIRQRSIGLALRITPISPRRPRSE